MQMFLVVEKISRQLKRVWEDKLWENICVVVVGKGVQDESFEKHLKKNQLIAKIHFCKHFSLTMSSNFLRYQPFVVVSGNLGKKVPAIDNPLSPHWQQIYPTTWFDENCTKFGFQTDRMFYLHLRQTYLALKLTFVKGHGYKTYKTKEIKKSTKEKLKRMWKRRRSSTIFLQSWCVHNQSANLQFKWIAHKSCIPNNFKGIISENMRVLHCEGYD